VRWLPLLFLFFMGVTRYKTTTATKSESHFMWQNSFCLLLGLFARRVVGIPQRGSVRGWVGKRGGGAGGWQWEERGGCLTT